MLLAFVAGVCTPSAQAPKERSKLAQEVDELAASVNRQQDTFKEAILIGATLGYQYCDQGKPLREVVSYLTNAYHIKVIPPEILHACETYRGSVDNQ